MIVRFCTISRVPKNGEMKGVGPIYIFACPTQAVLIKGQVHFLGRGRSQPELCTTYYKSQPFFFV